MSKSDTLIKNIFNVKEYFQKMDPFENWIRNAGNYLLYFIKDDKKKFEERELNDNFARAIGEICKVVNFFHIDIMKKKELYKDKVEKEMYDLLNFVAELTVKSKTMFNIYGSRHYSNSDVLQEHYWIYHSIACKINDIINLIVDNPDLLENMINKK